jgi:hypothetical protein
MKYFYVALGLALVSLTGASQPGKAQEKAAAGGTLKVKLNYTGAGKVDDKHKIILFFFDSPDFMQGNAMPFASLAAVAKDETVTLADVAKSPVYVAAAFDPSGNYDGQSGPPPSGSSMGIYSKTPGVPDPITVGAGKTVQVDLAFDDSFKMP